VDPLIGVLQDANGDLVQAAAWILILLDDPRAVKPLSIVNFEWRLARAVDELVDIGATAFEPLVRTLNHDSARMRMLAASGLGRMGDQCTVASLTATLKDKDERVRGAAAEALR
jgi:hypothetical protein